MCGKYSQSQGAQKLAERFGVERATARFQPRREIFPSQDAPVVVHRERRALASFRWGLIPAWARAADIGRKTINARSETITEKPSYRQPFERRRCLVPADAFYEKGRRVALRSRGLFAMAGLWDRWLDPEGREICSFTIVTTPAAPALRTIHDRTPAILRRDDEDAWLDPKARVEKLLSLLVPYAGELDCAELTVEKTAARAQLFLWEPTC